MILTVQTNTFGTHGGIPAYNRLVCRVLNDLNLGEGTDRILIAMDNLEAIESQVEQLSNLQIAAFGGARLRFVAAAMRVVARTQVELLIAGHINYAPLCLLLKLLKPKLRFGVFVYGCEVWDKIPLLRRLALRQADFVISISEYTKQHAVKINGLESNRVFVLPNAIEWTSNIVDPAADRYLLPAGMKLLSVGRLDSTEQRKGFDKVIESLPHIAKRIPTVQYIVVGAGTDLDRHKQLAERLGVSHRVHFLGSVDEGFLRQCYDSCDVFVMPSAQEGFGFVYLEAMQYRKPIVAANSGGAPEVVQDGLTGILVEYGNTGELSQALTDLCLDPGKRQKLGQAGHQRLLDKFTFAHFKQRLTEILMCELPSEAASRIRRSEETPQCAS